MRLPLVTALAACGEPRLPAPVGDPTPVRKANAAVADAPPPEIPVVSPELASAAPWTMRYLHVGLIDFEAGADVIELRRHDLTATLQVRHYPLARESTAAESPAVAATTTYLGAIEAPGREPIRIQFDSFTLSCTSATIPVATATARRAPSPGADECGDPGRWSPMTKPTPVQALRCEVTAGTAPVAEAAPHLAFGAGPGIEYAFSNDDCLQGGGWRAVNTVGTFEALRTP